MIELKNVTTKNLAFHENLFTDFAVEMTMALRRNSVEDFQALKQLLESGKKVVGREFLERQLAEKEGIVERLNIAGFEPKIFLSNNYDGMDVDDKSIRKTEKKTKSSVLAYRNPAICCAGKKGCISNLSIHELKHLLSHVSIRTYQNEFLSIYRYSENEAEKIITALNFFEEQIQRQALATGKTDTNLFIVDGDEKRAIVEEDIRDIVEYFTDSSDTYIWGELTLAQKRLLAESVHGKNTNKHQIVRNNMINLITNYTTLSEIQDGVKLRTLDRFVVTKTK